MIDKQELRRLAQEECVSSELGGFDNPGICRVILSILDELEACKADAERMERNRDMWKEQCAQQAKQLEAMRVKPFEQLFSDKCLACGGHHPGSGNLPCPKFTPMALGGKDG